MVYILDSLKRSVRRIRSKDFPRAPRCIEELHIPEQFRNSLSGKAFFYLILIKIIYPKGSLYLPQKIILKS